MEQVRLILAIVLSFLVLLGWNFFMTQQQPPPEQNQKALQEAARPETEALPVKPPEMTASVTEPQTASSDRSHRVIVVDTPLYTVEISEKGGVFQNYVLKNYRENAEEHSPPKRLVSENLSGGTVQTGFTGGGIPNLGDVAFYTQADDSVTVMDAPKTLTFSWVSADSIAFEKRFTFSPDTYLIGFDVVVKNGSPQPINGEMSVALADRVTKGGDSYVFEGPSGLINGSVEKVKTDKIKKKNVYTGNIKWVAVETRYFISGIIPQVSDNSRMDLLFTPEGLLRNQHIGPAGVIPPAEQKQFSYHLFFGPKSLKILKQLDNDLKRAIDFGMFDFLAKPFLWSMNFIHDYIPNYGVAIIILTIIIKVALWPLGNKSYKSMNEMKRIQPLMAEIREKYKDDKRKINEETMNLYRVYKINPMGGCMPMLLQIPVFFAFYRMLYEAIELRHAPFIGWVNDLSAPDRLFHFNFSIPFMEPPYGIPVLTIIMGGTMLIQQKMSPPPGDPTQAKMMMMMPIVFTFIFINFSSGLVLYWLVNNILSIAQQYYVAKKNV
jgi:YidC/Oxa1 family membrane protein insertase